jgi:hypothetical protein
MKWPPTRCRKFKVFSDSCPTPLKGLRINVLVLPRPTFTLPSSRTIDFQYLEHPVYSVLPYMFHVKPRALPTNMSLGTLLLFLLLPITGLDKLIAGTTTPHAASCHRASLIHPAYGVTCARHLSSRNARTYREDLYALIPGMAALLFILP